MRYGPQKAGPSSVGCAQVGRGRRICCEYVYLAVGFDVRRAAKERYDMTQRRLRASIQPQSRNSLVQTDWEGRSEPGCYDRPILDVDDLDCRPEWERGREALLAFIAEFNLPGAPADPQGTRRAQWLHPEMLISVELIYGIPVIALEGGCRRTTIPLADAEVGRLRSESRSISTEILAQETSTVTTGW
jgi:hypothetical protein